jgi:hypothetical protein
MFDYCEYLRLKQQHDAMLFMEHERKKRETPESRKQSQQVMLALVIGGIIVYTYLAIKKFLS